MSQPVFVLLSFEGPDVYAHAGGLGSRVTELSQALAEMGFETHLFFIGDPHLPGHEARESGRLHWHRWCQWISRYHPAGVYDGEEGKLSDWNASLPGWLERELLAPNVAAGRDVVVLGEEWQTTLSLIALHEIVVERGWQDRVHLLWNANNLFSFHRVPWDELKRAATITTVSRYMKHQMWRYGVDPRVIPNGIPERWLGPVERGARLRLGRVFQGRWTLVKVARWDPDKRWVMAVDAVAEMKRLALRPLLLARGGLEEHQHQVVRRAESQGLHVAYAQCAGHDGETLRAAITTALDADMVIIESYLSEEQRRLLFAATDAVLANSGIEPFGLVGLEAMAVGGMAFVGATGEDYATPGFDALSLQTSDPGEIVSHALYVTQRRGAALAMRRNARRSAARYAWPAVIRRVLLPFLHALGVGGSPPARGADTAAVAPARREWPFVRAPRAASPAGRPVPVAAAAAG